MRVPRLSIIRQLVRLAAWLMIVGMVSPLTADELPLHEIIDRHFAANWQTRKIAPADRASDAEFLRRVSLDFAGTIPTSDEVRAFLDDNNSKKRSKLIDRLLASPAYARHMQHVFDVMLNGTPAGRILDGERVGKNICARLSPKISIGINSCGKCLERTVTIQKVAGQFVG